MTEEIIIKELYRFFGNYDYRLSNVFIYAWESDFFCVSTSGYAIEVEVKISKSDFKADFKKVDKHRYLNEIENNHDIFITGFRPNRFYYACPEDMITVDEVPEYAGLLYFRSKPPACEDKIKEVKTSKFIHKEKHDLSKRLLDKYYYKSIDQAHDIRLLKEWFDEINKHFKYNDPYGRKLKTRIIEDRPFYQPELF